MYSEYAADLEQKRLVKFLERILLSSVLLVAFVLAVASLGFVLVTLTSAQGVTVLADMRVPN